MKNNKKCLCISKLFYKNKFHIHKCPDIRCSGMLGGVGKHLVTDVSGQLIGPILKGQAVQEEGYLQTA
jgi:hypothetical protein